MCSVRGEEPVRLRDCHWTSSSSSALGALGHEFPARSNRGAAARIGGDPSRRGAPRRTPVYQDPSRHRGQDIHTTTCRPARARSRSARFGSEPPPSFQSRLSAVSAVPAVSRQSVVEPVHLHRCTAALAVPEPRNSPRSGCEIRPSRCSGEWWSGALGGLVSRDTAAGATAAAAFVFGRGPLAALASVPAPLAAAGPLPR